MTFLSVPVSLCTHTASKFRLYLDLPAPRAAYTPSLYPEERCGPYLHRLWIAEHWWPAGTGALQQGLPSMPHHLYGF